MIKHGKGTAKITKTIHAQWDVSRYFSKDFNLSMEYLPLDCIKREKKFINFFVFKKEKLFTQKKKNTHQNE